MSQQHIVRSFDEDLRRLDNLVAQMGGLAEVQLADAVDALLKRDSEKASRIAAADERIDALERELDEFAIGMIARRQPMAGDLRVIVAALKTSNVLERIGDYAKNVAKRTVAISQTPPMGPTQTIARMAHVVQGMIKNVLDAYLARDVDKAHDVRQRDRDVDAMHTSLFRELLTYMMEDPRNITPCTHLLFIAKNIERIGDHATNIADNVHFLVLGDTPRHHRAKGDTSSYTVLEPAPGTDATDPEMTP